MIRDKRRLIVERFKKSKRNYLVAKKIYDEAWKRVKELNKPLHEAVERGEISEDELAEATVENQYKPLRLSSGVVITFEEAMDALKKAEDELIEAGLDALDALLDEEKRRELSALWDYWRSDKLFFVRDKVVNMFMKWEP
ncbi:MAG: hypothetical protein QXO20_08660 [Candidatus Bathyarchaeia archaeon]